MHVGRKQIERFFGLDFSYARPAELSFLHLQVEEVDFLLCGRGCMMPSQIGSYPAMRVFGMNECTSTLSDSLESRVLASTRNGFIVSQIDKKVECLG